MVIFQYNLYIFGIHLWTVLYPKPCYNEPYYKEVVYSEANVFLFIYYYYFYFFFFLYWNMSCGFSLEPTHQNDTSEYPQDLEIRKNIYLDTPLASNYGGAFSFYWKWKEFSVQKLLAWFYEKKKQKKKHFVMFCFPMQKAVIKTSFFYGKTVIVTLDFDFLTRTKACLYPRMGVYRFCLFCVSVC